MIKHYTLMSGIVKETISGVNKSGKLELVRRLWHLRKVVLGLIK